jgi:hypothetical protein
VVQVGSSVESYHVGGTNRLYVDVRHLLWERSIYDDSTVPYALIADKLRAALLVRSPAVRSFKVERRLMQARAAQARKSKARRG